MTPSAIASRPRQGQHCSHHDPCPRLSPPRLVPAALSHIKTSSHTPAALHARCQRAANPIAVAQPPLCPSLTNLPAPAAPSRASNGEVYSRLYDLASERARKMEERKRAKVDEEKRRLEESKVPASYISREMMRERGAGCDNYGEMLYQESIKALEVKREKVGGRG